MLEWHQNSPGVWRFIFCSPPYYWPYKDIIVAGSRTHVWSPVPFCPASESPQTQGFPTWWSKTPSLLDLVFCASHSLCLFSNPNLFSNWFQVMQWGQWLDHDIDHSLEAVRRKTSEFLLLFAAWFYSRWAGRRSVQEKLVALLAQLSRPASPSSLLTRGTQGWAEGSA